MVHQRMPILERTEEHSRASFGLLIELTVVRTFKTFNSSASRDASTKPHVLMGLAVRTHAYMPIFV